MGPLGHTVRLIDTHEGDRREVLDKGAKDAATPSHGLGGHQQEVQLTLLHLLNYLILQ